MNQAAIAAAVGDWQASRAACDRALAADPANPRALLQRAVAANRLGAYEAAIKDATEALGLGYAQAAVFLARSEAESALGRPTEALRDAESALRMNPNSAAGYLLRGRIKEPLGTDPEPALEDFRRAAELDVRLQAAYEQALARHGRFPKARGRGIGLWGLIAAGALIVSGAAWFRRRQRPAPQSVAPGESLRARLDRQPGRRLSPQQSLETLQAICAGRVRLSEESVSSPAYISPEAERGEGGSASQAFSLAVCLYEMLTGTLPFAGPESSVDKSTGRFPLVSGLAPGVPAGIDALFARALHPDPARRFHNGDELCVAFRNLVRPPVD
ncbi:MAG: hypothetical protein WC881_09240 [Elusimicrobiota bacterium]